MHYQIASSSLHQTFLLILVMAKTFVYYTYIIFSNILIFKVTLSIFISNSTCFLLFVNMSIFPFNFMKSFSKIISKIWRWTWSKFYTMNNFSIITNSFYFFFVVTEKIIYFFTFLQATKFSFKFMVIKFASLFVTKL